MCLWVILFPDGPLLAKGVIDGLVWGPSASLWEARKRVLAIQPLLALCQSRFI